MSTDEINEVGKVYERPWGTYQTLDMDQGYQVKVICVKPGGILSLQKHFKRSEHWVVVAGTPTLTIGDDVSDYSVGDNVFISIEQVHRMENRTSNLVKIIEVQIGSYLGEDDIVRLDDVYGRDAK